MDPNIFGLCAMIGCKFGYHYEKSSHIDTFFRRVLLFPVMGNA
jgi:hypothetical protein